MPSAIALIPARSGSERVPDKNVRPLAGHPLLAYAIATAQQASVFQRVVCSTDSGKIAEVAQRYGADVPFLRPSEFATSTSPEARTRCEACFSAMPYPDEARGSSIVSSQLRRINDFCS